MVAVMVFALVFLSGCISYVSPQKQGSPPSPVQSVSRQGSVTASLYSASIRDALDLLPSDLNVVYDKVVADSLVTLDVQGLPYLDYLYALSRSVGASISRHGLVWVMSGPAGSQESKSTSGSVIPMGQEVIGGRRSGASGGSLGMDYTMWVDLDGWRDLDMSSAGFTGLKWVAGDTWVYHGDLQGALDVAESVDVLRRSAHCDYYFEIVFVSSDMQLDFGSSNALGLDLDWRYALGRGVMSSLDWSVVSRVALSSLADVSRSRGCKVVSGVVREGVRYNCRLGDSMPFVKRTVSDQGTVTDTGVEYQTVGFDVDFQVQGARSGIVELRINSDDITGYNQGYAIKHGSKLETTFSVHGSEMRYVGSIWSDSRSRGLLSVSTKLQMWDVFLRVERLSRGQYMVKNLDLLQKIEKNDMKANQKD